MKCKNEGCTEDATHGYTWPGQERSAICEKHLGELCKTAQPHLLDIAPIEKPVTQPWTTSPSDRPHR